MNGLFFTAAAIDALYTTEVSLRTIFSYGTFLSADSDDDVYFA